MATLIRLDPGQKEWIKAYFKAGKDATAATQIVYGGFDDTCKIRGENIKIRLSKILKEIEDRHLDKMEYEGISGIDFYLGNLEREVEQYKKTKREERAKSRLETEQRARSRLEYKTVKQTELIKAIIEIVKRDCDMCAASNQKYKVRFAPDSYDIESCPRIQELIRKTSHDLWKILLIVNNVRPANHNSE